MMGTSINNVKSGQTIIVHTDDRPSTAETVTVSEVSRHEYSFSSPYLENGTTQGWYEVIDTDGNHWQFGLDETVELAYETCHPTVVFTKVES
jgi:hypothetical protein